MKLAEADYTRADFEPADAEPLDVFLLYEDSGTGLRAQHALASLHRPEADTPPVRPKLWRSALLSAEFLRDQAVLDAVGADVIILSFHGNQPLPGEVRDWLSRWLERKTDRPCALGLLLDTPSPALNSVNPVVAYVQTVASAAGADLFCGFCEAPGEDWGTRSEERLGNSVRSSLRLGPDYYRPNPYQHWGLNE